MTKENPTPQEKYAKKNKKQYKIDCIKHTEQDIIDKLESVPNKAGYIKHLIRKDIHEEEQKTKKWGATPQLPHLKVAPNR